MEMVFGDEMAEKMVEENDLFYTLPLNLRSPTDEGDWIASSCFVEAFGNYLTVSKIFRILIMEHRGEFLDTIHDVFQEELKLSISNTSGFCQ